MPNNLRNWRFKDVEKFLKSKGFLHINTRGSHFYFSGNMNNIPRIVTVPFHGSRSINPKVMKSIIIQSGVDMSEWTSK